MDGPEEVSDSNSVQNLADSDDEDIQIVEDNARDQRLRIDMSAIPCVNLSDQEEDLDLGDLGVTAYDQSCYEQNVMKQIDSHLDLNIASKPEKSRSEKESAKSSHSLLADQNFRETSVSDSIQRQRDKVLRDQESRIKSLKRKFDEDEESSVDEWEDEWKPTRDDVESEVEEDELDDGEDSVCETEVEDEKTDKKVSKKKLPPKKVLPKKKTKIRDDGNEAYFLKRIKAYKKSIEDRDEVSYHEVDGGLKVPKEIWDKLFPYQQIGVKWLWELHQACVGGIIGDEMGLGKTIQVISFLAALKCSKVDIFRETYKSLGPTVIVCPATVMLQWVQELHSWFPTMRVAILHATGSFSGKKSALIKNINKCGGILITTYSGVTDYQDMLYNYEWHYVILDEGHKIRNPDAQTTIACKRFRTPHRLILSGSPIQNNLKELWSLFDFVYPGKLGTLPVFTEQFSIPITQGGYANATEVQVTIAFKCASVLKDSIKPYLLRRMKEDVNSTINLPKKNEQVLFCKLTNEQEALYKTYLDSSIIRDIFRGSPQLFVALINLRKICNHPSLFGGFKGMKKSGNLEEEIVNDDSDYGYYRRSGKMQVVDALLRLWRKQEHKVLLFTQGTQMSAIIEKYLKYKEYTYLTMDGSTAIGSRQQLIEKFNSDKSIFVFLLTTRVGGIGVNLTGATRVLIFDPDWNPSTDLQARERAWRIGQSQPVTIYRLLSAGTIEEKMYHRQVFKMYLTNRVLKDPKQRRFFKTNDLYELFSYGKVDSQNKTESSAIFAGTGSGVKVKSGDVEKVKKSKKKKSKRNKRDASPKEVEVHLPPEKVEELRLQAKRISQMLANKFNGSATAMNSSPSSSSKPAITEKPKAKLSKKEKSKKGTIFEGERIKYLVKQDDASNEVNDVDAVSKNQDEYVLKKLFSKSTSVVHSAIQHDVIEGSNASDFVLVEKEAEKVASDAIAALKRSRSSCFNAASGIPTWTGNSGFLKKSSTKSASGGSASLLSAIKNRRRLDKDAPASSSSGPSNSGVPDHEELLQDLRSFLAFQSRSRGQASTQEILEKFQDRLPPSSTPVFKALLWRIADFHRNSDRVGVWKLKEEFA